MGPSGKGLLLVACIGLALVVTGCTGLDWPWGDPPSPDEPGQSDPEYPEGATVAVEGGLELLVPGTSYETLRQTFGEPDSYSETWEEGTLATGGEIEWQALFIVEEFDSWEIWAIGTESEGLTIAGGRWSDRRQGTPYTPPLGQPLEPGLFANPLRQLGILMQPEDVKERLGEPVRATITDGRPTEMEFRFLNVCWEFSVTYRDMPVRSPAHDPEDYQYGVSTWSLSWEPCR